jgi:Nif-specific regulatory protein
MASRNRQRPEVRREVDELSLLFEISRQLDESLDLREVVDRVLRAMSEHMGMERSTLILLEPDGSELRIDAAVGMSQDARDRGRYRLGEGVVGRVIETGEAAVVPRISQEPLFLNRTGARDSLDGQEISFICVPILVENRAIGALSVDRLLTGEVSFDEDVRLLSIISSMIAQAVRLRQAALQERLELEEENARLQKQLTDRFRPSNMTGNSRAMCDVYDLIGQVADSHTTVMLRGESGTGKEMVAQALHYSSPRSQKPFIKVNCAALPSGVIESELFGHEKGAFTDATSQRKGRFELAQGGTIFLDEIGDLSPQTQIRLLRVLQEREFERVGGVATIKADVRIITATHRNLEDLILKGGFREDLYYRLNVFPIHLPPLRDRRTDIPLLLNHFIDKYSRRHDKDVRRISTSAIDMLMVYHWPGNVRELENCIERAVLVANHHVIHAHHLPPTLQTAEASGTELKGTLKERLASVEQALVLDALKSTRGNMAKASRMLGITERIMGLRVQKYGISCPGFHT